MLGRDLLDGQLRVIAKIATGGMGSIYLAEQPSLRRKVAVKILHPELARRKDLVQRFHREAKATSLLTHPNIVRTYLYGEMPDNTLYLAMEFLEGCNLLQALRKEGPLSVARAVSVVAQIGAALDEAHGKGIIHRDLKSENIFLTTSGGMPDFPKVLDFGIATLRHGDEAAAALTAAGSVFGTPQYMSPEQARGRELDGRSDLYSLGVILYEALTGVLPWDAKAPMDFITCHITEEPLPMKARAPGVEVPREIEEVALRLLRKKPEDRYASGASLGRALVDAWTRAAARGALSKELPPALTLPSFAGASAGQVTVSSPTFPPPVKARRWPRYAGGAVLLLGAAAFGFWMTLPPPAAPRASLAVVVEPQEATLLLNGEPLAGPAPFMARDLAPGVYQLSAEAPGYEARSQEIRLSEGEAEQVTLTLAPVKPKGASLSVTVTPPEALLSLDGGPPEPSPLIVAELPPGPHALTISRPGFVPISRELVLGAGQKLPLVFWMIPEEVNLRVLSQPRGAEITLTDLSEPGASPRTVGRTSKMLKTLRGDHRYQLELSLKGYEPETRLVTFDPAVELPPQLSLSVELRESEEPPKAGARPQDRKRALAGAESMLKALDKDGSRGLSKSESSYIPGLSFAGADADKSGELSREELADFGPKAWGVSKSGKPSAAAVSRIFQLSLARKADELSACSAPKNTKITFTVGADGSVQGAKASARGAAAECVERLISQQLFLPPGRSLEIEQPLPR